MIRKLILASIVLLCSPGYSSDTNNGNISSYDQFLEHLKSTDEEEKMPVLERTFGKSINYNFNTLFED